MSALPVEDLQPNPFKVMKSEDPEHVPSLTEIELEDEKLNQLHQSWQQAKDNLEHTRKVALERERAVKIDRRNDCLSEAATLRELAPKSSDPGKAVEFIQKAKKLELEAAQIGVELGLADKAPVEEEQPVKSRDLSATKGLYGVLLLAIFTGLGFWWLGTTLVQNEENESAMRMMNSVGIRIVINFMLTGLAFLCAFLVLYLLFPHQFSYWHNRIQSELSLKSDLEASQPWQRILFFSFCASLPTWAFVMLMQVIFG